jgi:hypothetical protein
MKIEFCFNKKAASDARIAALLFLSVDMNEPIDLVRVFPPLMAMENGCFLIKEEREVDEEKTRSAV